MVNSSNEPQDNIFKPRVKAVAKPIDPNQLLYAEDLLCYYKFALDGQSAPAILQQWALDYPVEWIHLAIIEALYQGRYKAVSVAQILQMWQRRQQAQPHFDRDFEQLIRKRLPQNLVHPKPQKQSAIAALAAEIQASSHLHHGEELNAASNESLEELTQFVKSRRSRQFSVDAVIDHAEAKVDSAAQQAKQQITHQQDQPADIIPPDSTASHAIDQFTPKTTDSELIAKLRSVFQDADQQTS
jgi:hypothetical protein